ncbi:hypothetical protein HGRIS_006824 [Hohenbuehelia grisea]|uniref:Uncharacterized protein n=1 Tax=Hohenbuehelia grisea TaxID=104357 RepID=A0ABR3JAV6_9AGAR
MPATLRLDANLPVFVDALQKGWQVNFQVSATVSALFASIAATLFVFMKDKDNFVTSSSSPAYKFLLFLSYSSIVSNGNATITALAMTDRLGNLPYSAQLVEPTTSESSSVLGDEHDVLGMFGIGNRWKLNFWLWYFSFLMGILTTLGQILVYLFLEESTAVKISVSMVLIPLSAIHLWYFLPVAKL